MPQAVSIRTRATRVHAEQSPRRRVQIIAGHGCGEETLKRCTFISIVAVAVALAAAGWAYTNVASRADAAAPDRALDNPAIDMAGFLSISEEAAAHRESRRVSEADFLRMAGEPGTIILDARSREAYDLLHVEGAINLPFPDIAIASLAELIPDKQTRILIYCNNNFRNDERAFASKLAPASLNLSTFVSLYTYGYRNIYELGPRMDVNDTILPLVPSTPDASVAAAQ